MIDLSKLEKSPETTKVEASNNIFSELGKNTYSYLDVISELIDNSIEARRTDMILEVTIKLDFNQKNKVRLFSITDNANGISQDKLGIAITPAGVQSCQSLNEHGLGMKQAIAALGKLKYLATKTIEDSKARVIKEFSFGELTTYYTSEFNQESGTEISITDLKSIVNVTQTSVTNTLTPYLGARYRRFLAPDNKIMNLKLLFLEESEQTSLFQDSGYNIKREWIVKEVKPIYFHPFKRENKPVFLKHPISGKGWKAELTFGYAPQDKEYEELGLKIPNKFQPYYVSIKRQGLDVLLHDRVILFHQLFELDIVPNRHADYNTIRGEIDLKEGFETAITKNSIIEDNNFRHCLEKVRKILKGEEPGPKKEKKNYLRRRSVPDELPEKLLRDRLAEHLENHPIFKKDKVNKEYVLEGIEGYIDILADQEVWEIKTSQANALDIYQLFMYMDVGGFDNGYLVAQDFSGGAKVAIDFIKNKHNKEIILAKHTDFPITHPPSDEERSEYY